MLHASQALTAVEVWPAGRTASIDPSTPGYISNYCTFQGYYLSQFTQWRDLSSTTKWSGFQFKFMSEFAGPLKTLTYGT